LEEYGVLEDGSFRAYLEAHLESLTGTHRNHQEKNPLIVRGVAAKNEGEKVYLYRGPARRPCTREFDLADYVDVTDAWLADGLLAISLKRELPERHTSSTRRNRISSRQAMRSGS
jgi:hypothetical protein